MPVLLKEQKFNGYYPASDFARMPVLNKTTRSMFNVAAHIFPSVAPPPEYARSWLGEADPL
jgi:hypothetical protein